MPYVGGKGPVIGEKNKPRRPVIQATYGVKSLLNLLGQKLPGERPPLGVRHAAQILRRLMEDEIL
jgi:hypothetical protein